jgi:hypothetical protein
LCRETKEALVACRSQCEAKEFTELAAAIGYILEDTLDDLTKDSSVDELYPALLTTLGNLERAVGLECVYFKKPKFPLLDGLLSKLQGVLSGGSPLVPRMKAEELIALYAKKYQIRAEMAQSGGGAPAPSGGGGSGGARAPR